MAVQERVTVSRSVPTGATDAEERLLGSLRLSELVAELSALDGGLILKAMVAAAADTLVRELEGFDYKIGAFAGDDGEIELVVVMPSETKTLELAFGPEYVRPSLITATGVRELPRAKRPYGIRAYAHWLIGA